ncbi:MAG: hypothetical protein ABSE89_02375 [Sedimentisphaerales bacterium]
MSKQVIIWALFTAICLFSGCTQKQVNHEPVCLAGVDVNSAMERVEKVLLKLKFFVVKADPTIGYMRTNSLPGSQFFEIWKRDNRDGYSIAMSNLSSIRRTAELNFMQNNDLLCIDCNVTIERLSIPEKEIDSTARAYTMYTGSNETTANLRLNPKQQKMMDWINLGEDSNFEKYILGKINKEFTKKKGKR